MTHQEFDFTYHNTNFFGQFWKAKSTNAVVVIAHGMGEHSGRFNEVAKKLTDNYFSVVAFDHFGHGKTSGKRGHNPSFDAVLESLSITIQKAKKLFPKKPIFIYGHSMGGNVVINYALRKNEDLKGVIATSPFLKLAFSPPKVKLMAGKLLQKIAPSVTMGNELNPNNLSRNKNAVEAYLNDELVHDKISPNFSLSFLDSGFWAIKNADKLTTPLCIFHGDEDKITSHIASKEFVDKTELATLKLYKGGYHELQHDLCKEEMLQDVVDWLNSQL